MGRIIDIAEVLLELGLSSSATDEERAVTSTAILKAEGAVIQQLRYDPVQQERTEFYPREDFIHQTSFAIWDADSSVAFLQRESALGVDELQLQHLPIRSVSSLKVDSDGRSGTRSGSFPIESAKTEGDDFWPNFDSVDSSGNSICHDGILRSVGQWTINPGSIKVVYTAGYSDAEMHGQDSIVNAGPIAEAVLRESVRRVNRMFSLMKKTTGFTPGVFTSEKLGDYSYSIDASSITQSLALGKALLDDTVQLLEDFVNWGWSI